MRCSRTKKDNHRRKRQLTPLEERVPVTGQAQRKCRKSTNRDMNQELKEDLERMKKKGGTASFSLENGSSIQVNGENRKVLIEPSQTARDYFESKKPKKVIHLGTSK